MERTFNTPAPVELHVELDRGHVTVTACETAESTIRVEGDHVERVRIEQSGNQLSAFVEHRSVFDLGAVLQVWATVPTDSRVVVRTGSADVATSGRLASANVHTGSGDVELPDTTGPVTVGTGSGEVRIGTAGEARIKTGSGSVTAGELNGESSVATGSGDVQLGHTRGRALVKAASGGIAIEQADGDLVLNSASGDVEVGRLRSGEISVSTASGSVHLGVPPAVPVWMDVSTVTGRVDSDLVGAGRPGPGQESLRLRAKTVSGDVRLVQLQAAIDLR
jgi:DUF4097 and DUF4098 domain-containing protein YvlB